MITDELLAKIKELFNPEQIEVLEFTQGNRTMTVERQILYFYGEKFPYPYQNEETFLDGFALTLYRNYGTICKIAKLKEYACLLANKNAFQDSDLNIQNTEMQTKGRGMANQQRVSEILLLGKTRGGNVQRSDDYDGIDEYYDLEDKKNLKTDIQLNFKTIDFTRDIKKMKTDPIGKSTEAFALLSKPEGNIDDLITEKKVQIGEMPSGNVMQTGTTTQKQRNSRLMEKDFATEKYKDNFLTSIRKKYSEASSALQALETDIVDLRTRFWLSFAYLFRDYPTCL